MVAILLILNSCGGDSNPSVVQSSGTIDRVAAEFDLLVPMDATIENLREGLPSRKAQYGIDGTTSFILAT